MYTCLILSKKIIYIGKVVKTKVVKETGHKGKLVTRWLRKQ